MSGRYSRNLKVAGNLSLEAVRGLIGGICRIIRLPGFRSLYPDFRWTETGPGCCARCSLGTEGPPRRWGKTHTGEEKQNAKTPKKVEELLNGGRTRHAIVGKR